MTIKENLERLAELYSKTGEDWILTVSHILTEPTCPQAVIRPEGSNMLRYAVHANTIEEAIIKSASLVYREVILGEKIESLSPITNPDDHKEYSWLP